MPCSTWIDDTVDLLSTAAGLTSSTGATLNAEDPKRTIKQRDAKLATHRAALEAGADPVLVTGGITENQATRAKAEVALRTAQSARRAQPTRDDIAALVRANTDLVTVLTRTEPAERADLYRQLGLVLTYDSGKQKLPGVAVLLADGGVAVIWEDGDFDRAGPGRPGEDFASRYPCDGSFWPHTDPSLGPHMAPRQARSGTKRMCFGWRHALCFTGKFTGETAGGEWHGITTVSCWSR
ncbi:hypothetical protein P3T36_000007 [Kitasatospora sp. MAP12-15]|uniref:hypothetical protein n=1 Tax=unclassified Kitasatospora TaxID=2633591 RepID=UPI002475A508|nr:hypothetical protein [Kitasatospora sp. MAP12-44]MDH6109235.1 hypothetical protein [Kitasatospora sp. MAP12-44]